MQKATKILIIGAGSIGMRHLKNLFKLGYDNLVVSDPDKKRLKQAGEVINMSQYRDVKSALRKENPEIVFICSPTAFHIQHAYAAVCAGADVFIEKPFSHSLRGVSALMQEAEKRKRIVMIGCNYRFHRGWQKLRYVLKSGRFGKPLLVRVIVGYHLPSARKGRDYHKIYAASRRGGGVILDSGSHVVDYLQDIFGKISGGFAYVLRSKFLKIASEEAALMVFRHARGMESVVFLDYISKKSIHQIEVITDHGILTWNFIEDSVVFEDKNSHKIIYRGKRDVNQMFIDELHNFLDCVRTRKKPLQDMNGAKRVLRILLDMKRTV